MAILFQDNFDRANSVSLGADWVEDTDNYEINNNEVRSDLDFVNNTSGTTAWVTALAARANMTVQARLKTLAVGAAFGRAGLVARRTASNNFYAFRLVISGGTPSVILVKVVAGTQTDIGTVAVADHANYHKFRLEVFGDQINVYRDNVLILGPITDGSITAAGRAGIFVSGDVDGDRGFADDFFVADVAGDINPNQIDSDHVIPINFKYILNSDLVIPLLIRALSAFDNVIPIAWDMCKIIIGSLAGEIIAGEHLVAGKMHCLLRADQLIPLLIRARVILDSVIPITISREGLSVFDFVIAIMIRRLEAFDQTIPIEWSVLDQWVKDAAAQAAAWTGALSSESDVWVKGPASEPDVWAGA